MTMTIYGNKMHWSTRDFIINIGRAKIFAIHKKIHPEMTLDILLSEDTQNQAIDLPWNHRKTSEANMMRVKKL